MPNDKKTIRFVNSSFKDLFRINDGERIVMKYPSGELNIMRCEYLDEYHFKGRVVYHIFQFAEMCAKNHIKVMPYKEWIAKGIDGCKEVV